MPTIIETLAQLGQDLRAAIAAVLGLESRVEAKFDANSTNVTTIINNFLGRPAVVALYCDPVDGSEANDGLTIDTPKKDLDAIFVNIGTTATQIRLMNDAVMRRRAIVHGTISVFGVQKSSTGFIFVQRRIGFLGTAENSPAENIGTFGAGAWISSANFSTSFIDFLLPVQPANQTYPAHFHSSTGASFSFANGTLTVAAASGTGSLVGAGGGRSNVFTTLVLGSNAAGHLFQSVAAASNPNSLWTYSSNVTTA